jgi:hypothetical protein
MIELISIQGLMVWEYEESDFPMIREVYENIAVRS